MSPSSAFIILRHHSIKSSHIPGTTLSFKSPLGSHAVSSARSAKRLICNGICLLSVLYDRSSVIFRLAVIIEGGLSCYTDGSAIDTDIPVGINAIGIPGPHCYINIPAVQLKQGTY